MIEYHADDYGLFLKQSQRILNCYYNGVLNGISIIPNSPYLPECMSLIDPLPKDLRIAVHLNLIEGYSCCNLHQVPHLVDAQGKFTINFEKLLLVSLFPSRKKYQEYRQELKREIRAQIYAVSSYLNKQPLRIDSHAHFHMIPVVFDALIDVIIEEHLVVSYIRIPKEKITIYLQNRKHLTPLVPINFIKVVILNLLSARNIQKHRKILANMEQSIFVGVMYSGHMFSQNMQILLSSTKKLSNNVEILAHPGGVYETMDIQKITNKADFRFLTNKFREKEEEAFIILKQH